MFRPRDPVLFWVNIAGAAVVLMIAAYCWFVWTHPHYAPPCMPGYRAHCPPVRVPYR
ncbi:hypothetical protein [Phenylobacterium sp.]|uniref:hypothetical protein n=1 Tax=Phenylobacterium sp. TaxID=1871053 RepID=UPI002DE345E8|nr:hypothetical protein [Phenylobacterium sp.]